MLIGSQGYGLVNELERDGYDVGVPEPWHVPVTPQRVFDEGTYDAEIQFVSGDYIDAVRVSATASSRSLDADVRTDAERGRFAAVPRARPHPAHRGRPRATCSPRSTRTCSAPRSIPICPRDIVDDMSEMLLLGEPVAVFLAPPAAATTPVTDWFMSRQSPGRH